MIRFRLAHILASLFSFVNHIGKVLPEAVTKELLEFTSTPAFNTIYFKGILLKCIAWACKQRGI